MTFMDQTQRLAQPVARCMTDTFITLPSTSVLRDAARALRDRKIGLLLLTDGDELVGVISERDLVAAMANSDSPDQVTLADRASGTIITVDSTAPLQEGINVMAREGVRHLVVVSPTDKQPVGVLSVRDVISEIALL